MISKESLFHAAIWYASLLPPRLKLEPGTAIRRRYIRFLKIAKPVDAQQKKKLLEAERALKKSEFDHICFANDKKGKSSRAVKAAAIPEGHDSAAVNSGLLPPAIKRKAHATEVTTAAYKRSKNLNATHKASKKQKETAKETAFKQAPGAELPPPPPPPHDAVVSTSGTVTKGKGKAASLPLTPSGIHAPKLTGLETAT